MIFFVHASMNMLGHTGIYVPCDSSMKPSPGNNLFLNSAMRCSKCCKQNPKSKDHSSFSISAASAVHTPKLPTVLPTSNKPIGQDPQAPDKDAGLHENTLEDVDGSMSGLDDGTNRAVCRDGAESNTVTIDDFRNPSNAFALSKAEGQLTSSAHGTSASRKLMVTKEAKRAQF